MLRYVPSRLLTSMESAASVATETPTSTSTWIPESAPHVPEAPAMIPPRTNALPPPLSPQSEQLPWSPPPLELSRPPVTTIGICPIFRTTFGSRMTEMSPKCSSSTGISDPHIRTLRCVPLRLHSMMVKGASLVLFTSTLTPNSVKVAPPKQSSTPTCTCASPLSFPLSPRSRPIPSKLPI